MPLGVRPTTRPAPYPDLDGSQACAQADPEEWFPEKGGSSRRAIEICRSCPLVRPCLAYALTNEAGRYGIWGATTERQRRAIRLAHGITVTSHSGWQISDVPVGFAVQGERTTDPAREDNRDERHPLDA